MQALQLHPDGPRFHLDYPTPRPLPGEAIIRPLLVGVCSTDIELCRGYMGFKGVLGHEFVGVVESVHDHSDPKSLAWVGKRVVGTINCACGKCDFCARQIPEHCRDRTVLGILKRDGCFADAFTLPVRNLLEVPATVSDEDAVFTEPLAAAFQITRQVDIGPEATVTVLGDGRLGLLCVQVLAKHSRRTRLVGKYAQKMALARTWGIETKSIDEIELAMDQDVVVDCTGSAGGLSMAMKMVKPRGIVVMKTTVAGSGPVDLSPIVIHEINVVGSRCGPFDVALKALESGEIDVRRMITRRGHLSEGLDALANAKGPGAIKTILKP